MDSVSPTPPPLPENTQSSSYVLPETPTGSSKRFEFPESVLEKAKRNHRPSTELMFRQFIGSDEKVYFCEYLGQYGLFLSVTHSFACVTEKRIIALQVGPFQKILYQDAGLEDLNSGFIYQPSILGLYILSAILMITTLGVGISVAVAMPNVFFAALLLLFILGGAAVLLLPWVVRWYYKVNKNGLVGVVKEGLSVYVFANRNRLVRANAMWRICQELRDKRIKSLNAL